MNTKLGLLGAALVLQLILVVFALFVPLAGGDDPAALVEIQPDRVTALVIRDGDNEVEVRKADETWQVAGVRADADKITNTIDKLAKLEAPWPVATTASSAERFEVSADNYQRLVRLMSGDETVAELYLGTSPSYQQVHARAAASDDIYSVALSNYELGADVDTWLDKGVMATASAPRGITVDFVADDDDGDSSAPRQERLQQTDEGWLYNDSAADQDTARTYANRFTTLRVLGLADAEVEASPVARIELLDGDESRQFTLSQAGEDDYLIAEQGGAARYRLATYVAEQLLMRDAEFAVQEAAGGPEQQDS